MGSGAWKLAKLPLTRQQLGGDGVFAKSPFICRLETHHYLLNFSQPVDISVDVLGIHSLSYCRGYDAIIVPQSDPV